MQSLYECKGSLFRGFKVYIIYQDRHEILKLRGRGSANQSCPYLKHLFVLGGFYTTIPLLLVVFFPHACLFVLVEFAINKDSMIISWKVFYLWSQPKEDIDDSTQFTRVQSEDKTSKIVRMIRKITYLFIESY